MTTLLFLAWPLTVALAYLLGRRHGVALARVHYADERARGRVMLVLGSMRGPAPVVDVEVRS